MRKFSFRLVIAAAVLLALGRVFATQLVAPLLPAFAWVIEAADQRFRVDFLSIAVRPSGAIIESRIKPVRVILVGNQRVLYPNPKLVFTPSTLVGSVLQPIILLLAIVSAWPVSSLWRLSLRLLLAVPAIALLLVVNVPLGLIGAMLDFRELFPGTPVEGMVYWNDFLQTGGPLALAAAAGALVVSASNGITKARSLSSDTTGTCSTSLRSCPDH